jgi:hypothetical protein
LAGFGYAAFGLGKKPPQKAPATLKEPHMPVLLLVLLIIIVFAAVGLLASAVKFLLWVAIILAIIWLIGFFVRSAEGARWYRW